MSYDLAIFDPVIAPRERTAFLAWFEEQVEWKEAHNYEDPKFSTPVIRACFFELITAFPAMNGPYSKEELPADEPTLTDYSVGNALLYATFAWSKAERAYKMMLHIAQKHHVGFFNVSSDSSEVYLPSSNGKFVLL